MKKKIVASFLICTSLVFSTVLSSCSKTDGAETSATVTVIVDTTPSSDTPKETAVPYDVNNNTEFEEPILFEVTKEVIAYKDVSATEEAQFQLLVGAGTVVNAVVFSTAGASPCGSL